MNNRKLGPCGKGEPKLELLFTSRKNKFLYKGRWPCSGPGTIYKLFINSLLIVLLQMSSLLANWSNRIINFLSVKRKKENNNSKLYFALCFRTDWMENKNIDPEMVKLESAAPED